MAELGSRPPLFLVHIRGGQSDLSMMGASPALESIGGLGLDIQHVDTIRSSQLTMMSAGPNGGHTTLVVAPTTPGALNDLRSRIGRPGPVTIAPDQYLQHAAGRVMLRATAPRALVTLTVRLRILDQQNDPVVNCSVRTFGDNPAQAITDATGLATLVFYSGSTISDWLFVQPAKSFWGKWLPNPDLVDNDVVTLSRLETWVGSGFTPANPYNTWAAAALGLDFNDPTMTGVGIKVAVADSGCDTMHQLAQGFRSGANYADPSRPNDWNIDTIGHGTWCSTMIAGFDSVSGRRGIAPRAEMHTLKIFPGGSLPSLQQSLIYCSDNQIDVLSLSLGTPNPDPSTAAFIQEAAQHGVAIFVAAGNSYGPVAFPASEPGVCAVAAIGVDGTFPPDTYHAATRTQQTRQGASGLNGVFAPDFTAAGAAVMLCAPGVAVISGAPGNGFMADDGTSMACPQIAGLACIILAHHPAVRGQPRSAARTQTLFEILRDSCRATGLAGIFQGSGMPRMQAVRDAAMEQAPLAPQQSLKPDSVGTGIAVV